ncbi:MAG TPA: DUF2157 domain-containing protein [Opitutaceae bacterium]|nr:DUF2157 domain-containing protein [Opitutaceae bacterium]
MKSFEQRLRSEAAEWVKAGLISAGQQAQLLARHPAGERGTHSRFVAILGMVGGAMFLAGVALVISANWREISDWTKIIGLIALLAGAYAAGWRLKCDPGRYPLTGDALLMVGAALFMAGIALVSQIFHLNADPATGVLIWWVGIAAVPWLTRSKGAQFVSLFAFLNWFALELSTSDSWLALTPGATWWWTEWPAYQAIFVGVGAALVAAGLALRGTSAEVFAGMTEKWGFILACVALYLLGFLRHEINWNGTLAGAAPAAPCLVGGLFLIAVVAAWRRARNESAALAPWLLLGLVPAAAVLAGWNLHDDGWLWSAAAWTSLFLLNLAMIRVGLAAGRAGWVNLGIGFIALNIFTRYFDLFGTMLQGGVFFITTGAVIIALGIYLERKRRALLAAMAGKEMKS